MKNDIPIDRRFALAEKKEILDPDYISFFNSEPDGIYRWQNLLESAPLVILGEGRSGKTHEFEKQVENLRRAGNISFFIPLERLHDENLEDVLSTEDFKTFTAWKASPTAVAYFFLDALDELKLRDGSLRTAAKKIQLACEPHFSRLKLVLSCRPADWQLQIDSQHLEPFCVAKKYSQPTEGTTGRIRNSASVNSPSDGKLKNIFNLFIDKVKKVFFSHHLNDIAHEEREMQSFFIDIISKSDIKQGQSNSEKESDSNEEKILPTIVTLLPLSRSEIKNFAHSYSPNYSDDFCSHVEKHDFWHLYRLPAEIIDALDQMATKVPLGSLEDQLRLGIEQKLRELQPKKRRALSLEKARQGAERIALALFLLKRRTIKVEESNAPNMLDIGDILTDWTPEEQRELIGKTLFDPSGVGAVRFHHRATQEYLAAQRLHHLHEEGMHERDLFALLFSEVGGEEVIKPSMAPVAAWLALWHPNIRRAVLEREPRLLFSQGLPSALSTDIRAEVLRAYIKQYAGKGWCQSGIGHEELKRVAHPDLGPVIRELWEHAYTGHESRELLLEMIWLAPIPDCTDLALAAALDSTLEPDHRTYASWGVLSAGTANQKKSLAEAVLNMHLPQRVIRNILPDMVPSLIFTDEFLKVVGNLDFVPKSVHGLNYSIYETVNNGQLNYEEKVALRYGLAESIWSTRLNDCRIYQTNSEKDHYKDGLIACCAATIPRDNEDPSDWAWALAIAVHFGKQHQRVISENETHVIWNALSESSRFREAYFWACLKMADEIENNEDELSRFINATSKSRQSIQYENSDKSWLLKAVAPEADSNRRGVAFHAITQFLDIRNDQHLAETLIASVKDRQDWLETICRLLNPQPREPSKFELETQARDAEQKKEEEKRIEGWLRWRSDVLKSPNYLMDGEQRFDVLYNAQQVIRFGVNRNNNWGHWDSSIITRTLGNNFLECYRHELSLFWRESEVKLLSERKENERNSYENSWLLALTAVKSESEKVGWATSISFDDAVKAARISCIELNGFGGYIATLDKAHPKAVAAVVASEAYAQLTQLSTIERAEIFHDIFYHGTSNMKSAVSKRIAPHLSGITSLELENSSDVLKYVIRLISENGDQEDRRLAVDWLEQHLEQDENGTKSFLLSLLTILDPEAGCRLLLQQTEVLKTQEERDNAIVTFATVFGGRHTHRALDLAAIPEARRIPLLKNLVLRAYQTVRKDDDIEHEGTYMPGLRDNAQDARSFLLESLLNTKQPETLAAIHDLAKNPELAHIPDRLRQMAYEIAAKMSDMTAHPLGAFQAIDRDGAFTPFDNRSLLTAMMTRLDSFENDILHAEDTPIEALRALNQETDLRRFIMNWLRGRDRGVFDFTQEAVVVGENRTDIRFHPRSMQGYATVELKRETWTVRELEKALREQLVGQYLQHERCRTGCLLICKSNKKQWLHPDTSSKMSLQEVVVHLNLLAKEIMTARPELHIIVKGIDYSTS